MRRMFVLGLSALAVALLAVSTTGAEAEGQARVDRQLLRERWMPVINLLHQHKDDWERTERAVRDLDGVLDHEHALQLLAFYDEVNDAWEGHVHLRSRGAAVGPRRHPDPERPIEAYKIGNAMLRAIRGMSYADEVEKFKDNIGDTNEFSLRPRMAMMDAIARHARDHEGCREVLLDVARDPRSDTDMRIIAVSHLGTMADDDDVMNLLLNNALVDRSWRVRDAAVDTLVRASDFDRSRVTWALIRALAVEEGILRLHISRALQRITGQRFGTDPDEWADWHREREREEDGLPPRRRRGATSTRVFNTESFSNRYVFVLDASISMVERISSEERERIQRAMEEREDDEREPLDWDNINNKLDLAREEIIRSLRVMDPEYTTFTIIVFDSRVLTWKEELVPTTPRNIQDAAQWLRSLRPRDLTNVYGAISEAFDLSERLSGAQVDQRDSRRRRPRNRDRDSVVTGPHRDEALPDTIFFYSDGYSTVGKYAGDDVGWRGKSPEQQAQLYARIMRDMVTEFEERYRVSRISIHCIGIGAPQDRHTLSALSRATRGEYVPIGE
jgi:hypothetical protein